MLSDFDLEGKNKFQKAVYYLENYGISYTAKKALRKFGIPVSADSEYMTFCRRNSVDRKEQKVQRESKTADRLSFCIVCEAANGFTQAGWDRQTCKHVSRAKLKHAQNTSLAELLQEHPQEYFVFSGRDIRVQPDFLYEATLWITGENKEPVSRIRPENDRPVDMLYTDEDNCVGKKRSRPFFKPDADLEMLLNYQYLGRCVLITRHVLEAVAESGEAITLFGNDWYDLVLQSFRFAEHIVHVPKVLVSNCVEKEQADHLVRNMSDTQKQYLAHYMKTEHTEGEIQSLDVPGFFHIYPVIKEKPLISIIIPNKDHAEDLSLCLDSLARTDTYGNYEVIIAENNSEEQETFDYYDKIRKEDKKIHVVTWEGPFNYSAINNFAVGYAKGELLLFLNNDTEFIDGNVLTELAGSVSRPGVGAAGAMLYYGDKTIQHAGVIIGMGGFAAHALWSLTDRDETYYPFSLVQRNISTVTGACLMVTRDAYDAAGGMSEEYVVALNDVDFCLKIRAAGYRILFNPYAKLFHYESKSRGYEDTMEKQARFQKEIHRLQTEWETEITNRDPWYNPNLTLHRADYSMDI